MPARSNNPGRGVRPRSRRDLTYAEFADSMRAMSANAAYVRTVDLLSNHRIECWGQNFGGALGNGKTKDSSTPVSVVGLP